MDGLSFPAWHLVAFVNTVPGEGMCGSTELLSIEPGRLGDAQRMDASVAND